MMCRFSGVCAGGGGGRGGGIQWNLPNPDTLGTEISNLDTLGTEKVSLLVRCPDL